MSSHLKFTCPEILVSLKGFINRLEEHTLKLAALELIGSNHQIQTNIYQSEVKQISVNKSYAVVSAFHTQIKQNPSTDLM